ncbi:GNAT family N-acetyltransferase [Serinicoccus marinus]|uniref:GNAT family N-acetyltransferase n=1 Tax=Serinicoccus marinus TaxID=247333 RepID=UPI0009FFC580|nr:GNAT family N-acetyltransferase [Serinicoccus marinus]
MAEDAASTAGPVRDGDGVRLVPPGPEHVRMLVGLGQDELARRWGDAVPVRDETQARAAVAVSSQGWAEQRPWTPRRWVVETRAGDDGWQGAGTVEYRPDGHGGVEVGFAVHPEHRGHGVATTALGLALGYAFEQDGAALARWRAEVGNWASRRVAWRLGFSVPQRVRGLMPGWGEDTGPRDGWIATLAREEPRRPAYPWLRTPVLRGERVVLRPWREDADDAAALLSVDDLARSFVGPVLPPATQEGVASWLAAQREGAAGGTGLRWCIADAEDDAALGLMSVFGLRSPFEMGCGTVGYWLLPSGRGRGAVTEALTLASRYAFGELGLHRLAADADVRNAASHRALLRAGFRWVATEAQACVYTQDGEREDNVRFELLADAEVQQAPRPGPPVSVLGSAGVDGTDGTGDRGIPTLRTDGLVLRPWRSDPGEADRMVEAATDPVTRQYLPELPDPYTSAEALGFIDRALLAARRGEQLTWCVAEEGSDVPLGNVSLSGLDRGTRTAEVGYWAHPQARGRGVVTRAVAAVLRHAFAAEESSGLGLRRVFLRAAASNVASQRVARTVGMREVGRDRLAETLRDDTVEDMVRFDRLAEDDEPSAPTDR